MKFDQTIRVLGFFLLAAILGCSGPYEAETLEDGEIAVEDAVDVVALDSDIEDDILVLKTRSNRLGDGRLRVEARLQNDSGDELRFELKTVFKDPSGFATEDDSPWSYQILSEGDSLQYRVDSLNDRATNYVIKVREAE